MTRMFQQLIKRIKCSPKDELLFITAEQHEAPLSEENRWMKEFTQIKPLDGPRFPDGSINWQCPCMAGGSLVAHRCGHYFRQFYICVSDHDYQDATVNCPNEFVNWSACLQNLSEERKEQMRRAMAADNEKK